MINEGLGGNEEYRLAYFLLTSTVIRHGQIYNNE